MDREDPVARVGHVVMGTRLEPEAQVGPEGQMVPEALAERAVTGAMREHSEAPVAADRSPSFRQQKPSIARNLWRFHQSPA